MAFDHIGDVKRGVKRGVKRVGIARRPSPIPDGDAQPARGRRP
jgi:hypothetical protein